MQFDVDRAKRNLQEYKDLIEKLQELKNVNVFLLDIKSVKEYEEQIEKVDNEISVLKTKMEQLINEYNHSLNPEQYLAPLKEIKETYNSLINKSEILYDAWNIQTRIIEMEDAITKSVTQFAVKKKNEDIHALLSEAKDEDELKAYIDAVCISIYKIPLLVALITKDPSEIENDFQVSGLSQELRDNIIKYIEQKKREINSNLILSDKALIDLIENTTGKNITDQQRHNEIVDTGYNRQYNGQFLMEKGKEYALLNNQRNQKRLTSGGNIKRFNDIYGAVQFDRKDGDMLVRNFPDITAEDMLYRSFETLPDDRKSMIISVVLSNLKLCYEMFQSYYLNEKMEIPVLLNLTNGKTIPYKFDEKNLPHILGIPPTNKWVKIDDSHGAYIGDFELPPATINFLGIKNAGPFDVLKCILDKEEDIIKRCGLCYDSSTNTYYEMLPWEKIILKTNAFIRGDFFKSTSLISTVNPNSFLISSKDDIKRIAITPTKFSESAINQALLNPDISFEEAVKNSNSTSDFTFKGMIYDEKKGIWIPKTNASAIGERITPYNAKTLKTLEKYRYLLSGITNPSEGGFVASAESSKDSRLYHEYSVEEMWNALVRIADNFGTTAEIQNNLKEYLEQINQIAADTKSNTPKK